MKKLLIISLILIFFDQITKFIFTNKYYTIGNFGIYYAENTGAAFSILQGMNLLFLIISIIVIIAIIYYYKRLPYKLPLILLLAGTTGNLIDRIFFHYVRDFIMISVWPIFNLADSFNTIGVLLLIYHFWKEDKTCDLL